MAMAPRRLLWLTIVNGSAVYALALVLGLQLAAAHDEDWQKPKTVIVRSGDARLHARLWRPAGTGPFPAILLNHGSGRTREELERLGPYERQAESIGPVFAKHGYVLLYLFRRGVALSADQGVSSVDLMNREAAQHGVHSRNRLQLQLLEHREAGDVRAAIRFLRTLPDIDSRDIGLIGDSFGSSLTLLVAEREPSMRAVVMFATAGFSWDRSPELRARLLTSVARVSAPVFFIHAANDYTTASGETLDARRSQLGKPHRLQIYPAIGRTPEDGHGFLYSGASIWENDVFAFLDQYMRR
jgi:carboxymethylenebutenolidase